jgi:hypothetical protein
MPLFRIFTLLFFPFIALSQTDVPAVYSNIRSEEGRLYVTSRDTLRYVELVRPPRFTVEQVKGNPQGTDKGLAFDFGPALHKGTLYYGFIPYGDSKYPHPVYFRTASAIDSGRAFIPIAGNLSGLYDMVGWERTGHGTLGYRLVDSTGFFVYDGIVRFRAGADGFEVAPTITEGPFVNRMRPDGATISFTTNGDYNAQVVVDGRRFRDRRADRRHEVEIEGLQPG